MQGRISATEGETPKRAVTGMTAAAVKAAKDLWLGGSDGNGNGDEDKVRKEVLHDNQHAF